MQENPRAKQPEGDGCSMHMHRAAPYLDILLRDIGADPNSDPLSAGDVDEFLGVWVHGRREGELPCESFELEGYPLGFWDGEMVFHLADPVAEGIDGPSEQIVGEKLPVIVS